MTIKIENIIENLHQVFCHWNNQSKDYHLNQLAKKKQINLILPYIQLASFLNIINPDDKISKILQDFATDYKKFYDVDLSLRNSDFSNEIFNFIKIKESGKDNQISKVDFALKTIKEADKKYFHAHSRIAYNFGNLILQATDQKLPKIKNEDKEVINSLWQNFLDCKLEQNSDKIKGIDNLEEHALLNQISSFNQNLAHALKSIKNHESIKEIFKKFDNFNPDKDDHKIRKSIKSKNESNIKSIDISALDSNDISLTYGIEKEFVLILLEKENVQNLKYSPYLINAKLKESLADISARNLMQKKYNKDETVPAIKNLSNYFITDQDLREYFEKIKSEQDKLIENIDNLAIDRKDYLLIKNDLTERLINQKPKNQINEIVKNFTRVEAFFYKLFFLSDNKPYDFKIEVDGVFDPNSDENENFKNAFKLIDKGIFHANLFDMIQANEISLGVFKFNAKESLSKIDEAYNFLKLTANDSGLSIENPNAQVNFSISTPNQNLLLVKQEENSQGQILQLSYNNLAIEFLKILQNSLIEIGDKTDLFRDQDQVSVRFDLKKIIGTKLKGTNYHNWLNSDESAFTQHKKLAAKTATIRTSLFSENAGVAEVRMIGNNPHFAIDYEQARILDHSFEYITKDLIEKVATNFNEFIANKNKSELNELLNSYSKISHHGLVETIPPLKIQSIIDRCNNNQSKPFSQTSVRDSMSLCHSPKQSFMYR